MPRRFLVLPLLTLLSFIQFTVFAGCAGNIYPITTGSHTPIDPANRDKKFRFVVWATHPTIATTIMSIVQQAGHTAVERSRLDQVFKEQEVRLTHTPDDNAQILRVGKLVGADRVIFAEHSISSNVVSGAYFNMYGGGSHSSTVYHVSVSVRAVTIETGEIRWSGTAHYPKPINNPEAGLNYLTQTAIARALCPIEMGYEWKEANAYEKGGCLKKE